jgi:electron transfer flavoprotein alpha subunit
MESPRNIWVLANGQPDRWSEVTLEMLADARTLADKSGQQVWAVAVGPAFPSDDRWAAELGHHGADRVVALESPALERYATDSYLSVLTDLAAGQPPSILLLAADRNGADLAPRLAVWLGGAIATACSSLRLLDDGTLEAVRPAWADKGQVVLQLAAERPRIITLRPGVAGIAKANTARTAPVERIAAVVIPDQAKTHSIELIPADPRTVDIKEAERVIAGGRGVGGAEGFALLGQLADQLDASIAASRVAVDLGWVPYERQVGQTGRTVKPKLYIACGISGASQHVMGMQEADVIIAINQDKNANIFKLAHLSIAGDVFEVIPALIQRLRAASA